MKNKKFIQISVTDSGIYALSSDGKIYFQNNGAWNEQWYEIQTTKFEDEKAKILHRKRKTN